MTNSCLLPPPKTSVNWPRSFRHRSKCIKPDRKGACVGFGCSLSASATRCFSEESAHSCLLRGVIQKAIQTGRKVLYGDGSVDASDARAGRDNRSRPAAPACGRRAGFSGTADSTSHLKARTALTVYQAIRRTNASWQSRRRKARWSIAPARKPWCSIGIHFISSNMKFRSFAKIRHDSVIPETRLPSKFLL
jgi:hypothetical protein